MKRVVNALYNEQLHRGDQHGLLKGKTGRTNSLATWNFSHAFFTQSKSSADGARFEKEIRKQMFAMLDTDGDPDAAAAATEMTPAQRVGLRAPDSIVPIIYALAGSCASAPDFATLATLARGVLFSALTRAETRRSGGAPAASSEARTPLATCPSGHALLFCAQGTDEQALQCDVCSSALLPSVPRCSCSICDYDVCEACGTSSAAAAAEEKNAPSPQAQVLRRPFCCARLPPLGGAHWAHVPAPSPTLLCSPAPSPSLHLAHLPPFLPSLPWCSSGALLVLPRIST